uniref:Uncharacterized protein n=1 Tax=Alexandrium catenella TaxID=2925 RepID=A0A7S1RVD6_ALECA|mmetsp:Transcript_75013/g.199202  ORF Transcript_75013/g.199202 Transcript_75013/m.199202 type:complete len:253 (+) Transcript_75013:104-862(+)
MPRVGILLLAASLSEGAVAILRSRRDGLALPSFFKNRVQEMFWRPHGRHTADPAQQTIRKQKAHTGGSASARLSLCALYPLACQAPFSCDKPPNEKEELKRLRKAIALEGGHANLHAWCSSVFQADYIEYVDQCLKGNMEAAVTIIYKTQKQLQPDGSLLKADADYCASAGLCDVPEVTVNTTLAQAERICDRRYTHAAWTTLSTQDLREVSHIMTPNTAPVWGQLACAMGNFHCDVVYCRTKHCKPEQLRN